MRVGNTGCNEIGMVQFIGFAYQTRGVYYARVEAFSLHFQHNFRHAYYG